MKIKKMYYLVPVFILAIIIVGFVATQPVNSLTVDVNPSIELVTSRLDRVVEINPLNEDGKELLKDFKAKDKNLENTVNDLVDLMILTGHIKGGEDNFVMITVEDDSIDSKFVDKVNKAIAAMLENKQIEATVLNQAITKSEAGEKQTGVQLAAQKLYEIDNSLTMKEIEDMTVRELVNYSNDKNLPMDSLFKVIAGNLEKAKESKTIISQKRAEEIALGVVNGKILKIELDDVNDHDGPEYEIEILADNGKYDIEIDAYTGEVKELEKDDDYDETSEKPTSSKITADQAKKIALDKVKGGTITEFELDDDEYEIEMKKDGFKYDIEIDAYTGKIKKYKEEKDDDNDETSEKPTSSKITADQAKKIALDKVKGGTITEFELDDDEYEIEMKKDGFEYDIEIDAYTGKIKKYKEEKDDDNDETSEKPTSSKITADQAKKIALDKVKGGTITEFELDDDEYEIEMKKDGFEYDLEIDAYTGEIKKFEKDEDDDLDD